MKKHIFACISLMLCILLCACEEQKPAETTTAAAVTTVTPAETTTASVETTAVTTTFAPVETTAAVTAAMPIETTTATAAPTPSTEPTSIEKQASLLHTLSWVSSLNSNTYDYDEPQVTFAVTFPAGWSESGYTCVSPDQKQYMRLPGAFYAVANGKLQDLPTDRVLYGKLLETVEEDGLLLYIYEDQSLAGEQYPYFMQGYSRVQGDYYWNFRFYTDSADTALLKSILQTVTLVQAPDDTQKGAAKVQIREALRTVRIEDLCYVSRGSLYEFETEALPAGSGLEIGIPTSWQLLPTKNSTNEMCDVIYAELGMPGAGLSPDACLYQAFCSDYLYIADTANLSGIEGTTADGRKYWLTSTEREDYHAVEYRATVQVSDTYFYAFTLCADKDNTELIYQILDSVTIVTSAETATTPIETTAETQVPILEDTNHLYTIPLAQFGTPITWFYSLPLDPSAFSLSFQTADPWEETKENKTTNQNAVYVLPDQSTTLTFSSVWDVAKPFHKDDFPFENKNGTLYGVTVYTESNGRSRYNFRMQLTENLATAFSISGEMDMVAAQRYAQPILETLRFHGEDFYASPDKTVLSKTEWKKINLKNYNCTSVAQYYDHASQSPLSFDLFISIPENWNYYSFETATDVRNVFSVNIPDGRLLKDDACFAYSSLWPGLCYVQAEEFTQEWVAGIHGPNLAADFEDVYEGKTSDNRQYIVYQKDIPAYHATEYLCYVQISLDEKDYVWQFRVWGDSEDSELIVSLLNSVYAEERETT